MANPSATPKFRGDHSLVLTDTSGNVMGLNIVNPNTGMNDETAIQIQELPNSGIQMYQGTQRYVDTAPPWSPIQQDDWSMGQGKETFYKDENGYQEGRAWVVKEGQILAPPMPMYTYGHKSGGADINNNWWIKDKNSTTQSFTDRPLVGSYKYLAMKLTGDGSLRNKVHFVLTINGTPVDDLRVSLYNDSSGSPGTEQSYVLIDEADYTYHKDRHEFYGLLDSGTPYSPASTYWLVFYGGANASIDDNYEIMCSWDADGKTGGKYSTNGSTWTLDSTYKYSPWARVETDSKCYRAHFFQYKGGWYKAVEYDDHTQPKLFISGDRGVCYGTQNIGKIVDSDKSWTADEWIGAVVVITTGTGSRQRRTWRRITDNDATSLTLASSWDIIPVADDTQYVIVSSEKWTEIATTATPPDWDVTARNRITDVLVYNNIVYFCHGSGATMTSLSGTSSSHVFAYTWIAETVSIDFIIPGSDMTGDYLVGAVGGYSSTYQIATAPTSHAALTWGTAANVWDSGIRLHNLINYGDYGEPFALKEDGFYRMIDRKWFKINVPEMAYVMDSRNGKAAIWVGSYLYTSWGRTLIRYFRNNIDTIGPDREEIGLPSNVRGEISAIAAYMGQILIAVDGGDDNYSTILTYNKFGWSEIFRTPNTGLPIRSLAVQSIDGENVDRLWYTMGDETGWLSIDTDPARSDRFAVETNYLFSWQGEIVTPWHYMNRRSTEKLFKSLSIMWENRTLPSGLQLTFPLMVYYRTDNDYDWTYSGTVAGYSKGTNERTLSTAYDVTGKRIQFRIVFHPNAKSYTPILQAFIIKALVKSGITNESFTCVVRLSKTSEDTYGDPLTKYNKLVTWSQDPEAILLESDNEIMDGMYCVIQKSSVQILQAISESEFLVQLTLIQIDN